MQTSHDVKCVSLFNHVPTYNILDDKANFGKKYIPKLDYNTNSESYSKRNYLFVNQVDAYKYVQELTEP